MAVWHKHICLNRETRLGYLPPRVLNEAMYNQKLMLMVSLTRWKKSERKRIGLYIFFSMNSISCTLVILSPVSIVCNVNYDRRMRVILGYRNLIVNSFSIFKFRFLSILISKIISSMETNKEIVKKHHSSAYEEPQKCHPTQ